MKKTFNFMKGDFWDGDEELIQFLEEYLPEENKANPNGCLQYRKNWKITLIIEENKD